MQNNIRGNVMTLIKTTGLNFVGWRLTSDVNNNFLVMDTQRGGAYRMIKTGKKRTVRASPL